MTNSQTQEDLNTLTENIQGVQSKPYLEPTLRSSLASLGHDEASIDEAMKQLFGKRTLQ